MAEAAICIRDLSFSYNSKEPIFEGVSLEILQGQWIGLIGPNGGGKSTLVRLILGLEKVQGGCIDFTSSPGSPSLGFVPQKCPSDSLFPISVLDVVLMGRLSKLPWHGWVSKKDQALAREALEMVQATSLEKRSFGSLSSGQMQRVLIARALISNPKILILDEPTASVDPAGEKEINQVLASLKGKVTILMVTHNLPTVLEHVDQVVLVQRGLKSLAPNRVCEHFAVGLYHQPLTPSPKNEGGE